MSANNGIDLAPLVNVDDRERGTFRFIMTNLGFMALETEVTEDDVFLDVPFEVKVTENKGGISFNATGGQLLSFPAYGVSKKTPRGESLFSPRHCK